MKSEVRLLEFCKSRLAPPRNPTVDEVETGRPSEDVAAIR
jgi:hypothetical protein